MELENREEIGEEKTEGLEGVPIVGVEVGKVETVLKSESKRERFASSQSIVTRVSYFSSFLFSV